jgi:hypothetical protein
MEQPATAAADGEEKPRIGRPPTDIDPKKLEALCQVHATDEEIAAHFVCSVRTIERLKKNPAYASLFEKGRADGKISLRRAQWQEALAGNTGMLVWLGKQVLGQRERLEHSGPDGGPIRIERVREQLEALDDESFEQLAAEAGLDLGELQALAKVTETKPTEIAGSLADGLQETHAGT